MKFKIGFTIEAETMFRMLAQFLPVDDLHVEEVPTATKSDIPKSAIGRLIAGVKPVKQKRKRPPTPIKLHEGINGIIIDAMSDGQAHRAVEFKPLLKQRGYSEHSVTSRLEALKNYGVVEQMSDSTWRLTQQMRSA
jgi:hypothetical protein